MRAITIAVAKRSVYLLAIGLPRQSLQKGVGAYYSVDSEATRMRSVQYWEVIT